MPNNEEQDFRDRLYDYESPVDAEAVWAAVQPDLAEPAPVRKYWWLLGVLVLLVVGAGLLFRSDFGARPQDAKEVVERGGGVSVSLPEVTASGSNLVNSSAGKSELLFPAKTKASEENTDPQDKQKSASALREKMLTGGVTNLTVAAGRTRSYPKGTGYAEKETTVNEALTTPTPASSLVAPQEMVVGRIIPPPASTRLTSPLQRLDLSARVLPVTTVDAVPAPTFSRQANQPWSVELATTASLIGQLPGGPEPTEQELVLASIYRPQEAVTGELLLGYRTRNGWSLRSGGSITRINSVVEYRTELGRAAVMTEGIVRLEVVGNDTTAVVGQVNATEVTTRTQRYHNHVTLFNVPILLGKRITRNRWSLGLEAGPVVNLRTTGDVRYLLDDGEFSARADSGDFIRSSLGVSARVGVDVGYRLTDRLGLRAGAQWQNLSDYNLAPGDGLRTRTDLYGVRLGLNYRW